MLDLSLHQAVSALDDARGIIAKFNRLYANTVYPPVAELQTSLLVSAIESKHAQLAEMLLDLGYPVNYKYGYASPSPLHAAVYIGDVKLVQLLLLHDASVNLVSRATLRDSYEVHSAVEFALKSDRPDLLELMEATFIVGHTGYSLLHLACLHGSVACLDHLLASDKHQSCINAVDNTSKRGTPLMSAVKHGVGLVQRLLSHGASVNQLTADYHCTVLHLAASRETYSERQLRGFVPRDFTDIVRLLIAAGCSVNAVDICGETALGLLCAHVQTEVSMSSLDSINIELLYDITEHRSIILSAAKTLLEAGASACGEGSYSLPLGVLAHQVQILLGLLAQSDEPVTSVELALITCHKLFVLVLSFLQDTFNGWRPEVVAVNVLDMLCQYGKKALSSNATNCSQEFLDKIIGIVFDFFRILLLLGAARTIPELTSSIHRCLLVSYQRFSPLLTMLLNVINESDRWSVKRILRKQESFDELSDITLHLNCCDGPRSLQQLCRVTILSCLNPVKGMFKVEYLNLPQRLTDFILLLN